MDTFFFKLLNGLYSENIISCFGNKGDVSAKSGSSDSLVGSFTSWVH